MKIMKVFMKSEADEGSEKGNSASLNLPYLDSDIPQFCKVG